MAGRRSCSICRIMAGAAHELRPQVGPQEAFLSTPADIAIMGGSVFGGKTWALTAEPLRHIHVPGFTFAGFRRVKPDITHPGGWWDETLGMYPHVNGVPRGHVLEWEFPSGARGKFDGLQYDADVLGWKGSQICLLLFDQLEEFSGHQFWYMLSRNRSMCGVRPYVRATVNPDPDSFVAELVAWWIDQDTGYAIPERSGVVRWFIRVKNELIWADSRAELERRYPSDAKYAKSLTFILARLQDNAIGQAKDPGYEANVRLLPHVEQERLLGGDRGGNWKIRAAAGLVFNRGWFEIVDAAPSEARWARGWDKAATAGGGDWTAGVRMGRTPAGLYVVEDVTRGQWDPGERERTILHTTQQDGHGVRIALAQDPGAAGVSDVMTTIRMLAGYDVTARPETGNKVVRAGPYAAQAKAGNVKLVRGPWNEPYVRELHAFPTKGVPDDQVDASSTVFQALTPLTEPLIA